MRGRKPQNTNVVPLTGDAPRDFTASAKQKARRLKPRGLEPAVSKIWDRIALHVCHPTVARLSEHNVEAFVMMCWALARHERIRAELVAFGGETYESKTRNGVQLKSRPEVSQLNESFRQFITLARDFGLTPAAERGLKADGQGAFNFDEDDFA